MKDKQAPSTRTWRRWAKLVREIRDAVTFSIDESRLITSGNVAHKSATLRDFLFEADRDLASLERSLSRRAPEEGKR